MGSIFIEGRKDTSENKLCQYLVQYGDGSDNSTGNLAFETLTLASTSGRSIQLPNIAFGCGRNNVGESIDEKGSGLVGLGVGLGADADIKLEMRNYFVHGAPGIVCLSFFPSESSYIYGNVAQINFLIEYALEEKKVFFKPTDCTKQG
ncbi:hypothetical protein C5167_019842 [Papaver somniferum]|uniref:Xylanase inhibitor N-terminal domain-containing protein n=1 Tax=Papaver somniferum TaxID=3469 RepID=A0A4Y7IRU6_PAPSO|nr:hypothetical protein C5167_019842 [Papaver somniferum]